MSQATLSDRERWVYEKVGEFVFRFSTVEFMLRWLLVYFLDLPRELRDPITASYDFRTLCAVTLATCEAKCPEAEKPDIRKLIERCHSINVTRNRIVHGTWSEGWMGDGEPPGYRARHMSRQSLKVTDYFRDLDELARAVEECRQLVRGLSSFSMPYLLGEKARSQGSGDEERGG
jgi:hypothetical protein